MNGYGYKIVNRAGLYSKGGRSPQFSKHGKFWGSKRGVLLHLALFTDFRKVYQDCLIEEYAIELNMVGPIGNWMAPIEAEHQKNYEKLKKNLISKGLIDP